MCSQAMVIDPSWPQFDDVEEDIDHVFKDCLLKHAWLIPLPFDFIRDTCLF